MDPAPNSTHALPTPSPDQPGSRLLVGLVGIYILVIAEWIIFIAAFSINIRLNDEYFSYVNAGLDVPLDVGCPPFAMQGIDRDIDTPLILCLLPLAYNTSFLGLAFAWAYQSRLDTVFVLCVSVFAFPMWIIGGSFNVVMHRVAVEEEWDPGFKSLFGFFAALQIVLGVAWLLVMIASAKTISKAKKDKWVSEGMERGVRRRVEEHQMQKLPAHQA